MPGTEAVSLTALRSASAAVLYSYPFEEVVTRFHLNLGLHIEQNEIDRNIVPPAKTDWLGQAVLDLDAAGVEIPVGFSRQVSCYGWVQR